NGVFRNKVDYLYATGLAQSEHPANSLFQNGGVPWQIHVDYHRGCMLKVEPHAAGIRRKKQPARRILVKLFDQRATFGHRHATMKQHMIPATLAEPLRY